MGIGHRIGKLLGWLSFGWRERPRRNTSPSQPQSSSRHQQPVEHEAHFARPNEPWSLPQSSLRTGELVQPETDAGHPLWVAFSAQGMDQARLGRLGDKSYLQSLLNADRAASADRTEEEADLDAYCMAILMPGVQVQAIPFAPVPAEMLEGAVGYGEAMLETGEKSNYALYLVVNEPNAQPARIGWTLAHHLARIVARCRCSPCLQSPGSCRRSSRGIMLEEGCEMQASNLEIYGSPPNLKTTGRMDQLPAP